MALEALVYYGGEAWRAYANCKGLGPDLFYPETDITDAAKEICRACVVREECLEYALANREKFGVWGGMTKNERQALLRERMAKQIGTVTSEADNEGQSD